MKRALNMSHRLVVLLIFIVLIFIAAFCFSTVQAAAVEPRGVFKMAIHWGMSADYNDPSLTLSSLEVTNSYMFHDALLKPMPDEKTGKTNWYAPCLAESWTISPDHRVYEFRLRKGVKFHNGDEMTAEDVVFSFKRYKGIDAGALQSRIEKLEAVNPYLFRVTFKEPFVDFLESFLPGHSGIGWVVPKKYIEKVGDAAYKRQPVGCGPYKFVEFIPGNRLIAEAFPQFWRKVPHIKRLEFYLVSESATRYAMVTRGEVDASTLITDILLGAAKKDKNLRTEIGISPVSWIIYIASQWNPKSPWSNPLVRKAASLALDRQLIADMHYPSADLMGNFGLKGDPDNIFFPPDPYDPQQAKKLLAEAGYPNGFHGGTFVPYADVYVKVGEMIANYWKAMGITMDTVIYDRPTFNSKRRNQQLKDNVFLEGISPVTLNGKLSLLFGPAGAYGKYPDIEEVWGRYKKSTDPKERKDLITRVQHLYHDRTMFINLVGSTSPIVFGPKLKAFISLPPVIWWVSPMEDLELNSYD